MSKQITITQEQYDELVNKANANATFKISKSEGVSKANGKPYTGFKISGEGWGYVSKNLLKTILDHADECRKALAS